MPHALGFGAAPARGVAIIGKGGVFAALAGAFWALAPASAGAQSVPEPIECIEYEALVSDSWTSHWRHWFTFKNTCSRAINVHYNNNSSSGICLTSLITINPAETKKLSSILSKDQEFNIQYCIDYPDVKAQKSSGYKNCFASELPNPVC